MCGNVGVGDVGGSGGFVGVIGDVSGVLWDCVLIWGVDVVGVCGVCVVVGGNGDD